MIISGHLTLYHQLQFWKEDERLLNYISDFKICDINNKKEDRDGNYVVIDTTRNTIIRSGTTENGMMCKWREHSNANMLKEYRNRSNKFYSSYPNKEFENKELITGINAKGNFHLSLRQGIGMKQVKTHSINDMFLCNDVETSELEILKGNGKIKMMKDKKYHHLCYMFELAYALAIEPSKNISKSTGSE